MSWKTGGVFARLAAALVDILVLSSILAIVAKVHLSWWSMPIALAVFLESGYRLHGSVGKSMFGLSLHFSSRGQYYLRETIGKLASFAIFGIGFLLIFSKDGRALHDLIANTTVVPIKNSSPSIQGVRLLLLMISVGAIAYFGGKIGISRQLNEARVQPKQKGLEAITRQVPAVLTIYCYNAAGKLATQGSGFLIGGDGLAVTNFHVLKGAYRAEAELGDSRLYQVLTIRAFDRDKDIVVLQLGRRMGGRTEWPMNLPHLAIGSSSAISVGDRVATISSPEGLANTVTDGLISAVRREAGRDLIQLSAPVSPGSSGSPVFDLDGNVVAVTVAQYTEGQNLNFAVPIEEVSALLKQQQNMDFAEFRMIENEDTTKANADNASADLPREATRETHRPVQRYVVTGFYSGIVHNRTANLSARLFLLVRQDAGHLSGCAGVLQPLMGSGPVIGVIEGSRAEFTVERSDFNIAFDGKIRGNQISGGYVVLPFHGSSQNGDFHLNKVDSKIPEFSGKCPSDEEMNAAAQQ